MDILKFYTGEIFNAYEFLGAHIEKNGTTFRVFAPNAKKVSIIGDFSEWHDVPMQKIYDGNFYECFIENAVEGMKYKIRIYEKNGRFIDHCDPYGFGMDVRPQNSSIIRNPKKYTFHDKKWLKERTDGKKKAVNIYEIHLGSWQVEQSETCKVNYKNISEKLIPYVLENKFNSIEIMPLCEYPCDSSWGYQAVGYYSPTSRYGDLNELKYFIDKCHQNGIGVILDFVPVHFALDDFGIANFDGTALYEYPYNDIAYNEWGSKNFAHSRGEVRSFLQSSVNYWIKEYHFDGIRFDAISNMIYWQGNPDRGINKSAVTFLQFMNEKIKEMYPEIMLIAEDSTAYPNITLPVNKNGLGFDYKWDLGWMNDTLEYLNEHPYDRKRDYHKLTFSMHYFYSENFLLPLSHDEVVHGKGTIINKMFGEYNAKFAQARALYMYMYAHPGKKLNFMGNEFAQFREWDEDKQQDWNLLEYEKHKQFHEFFRKLNSIYFDYPAFYEKDYEKDGFIWNDISSQESCIYAFTRKSNKQQILAIFNFSDTEKEIYHLKIKNHKKAVLFLDSNWKTYGGYSKSRKRNFIIKKSILEIKLEPFCAKFFELK